MNRITINGKTLSVAGGASVSVINNKLFINGKVVNDLQQYEVKNIKITIEGDCGNINTTGDVTVKGNCKDIDCNGSVTCYGDINGDIDCNGSVSLKKK